MKPKLTSTPAAAADAYTSMATFLQRHTIKVQRPVDSQPRLAGDDDAAAETSPAPRRPTRRALALAVAAADVLDPRWRSRR